MCCFCNIFLWKLYCLETPAFNRFSFLLTLAVWLFFIGHSEVIPPMFQKVFQLCDWLNCERPWRAIACLASSLPVHPHWWSFRKEPQCLFEFEMRTELRHDTQKHYSIQSEQRLVRGECALLKTGSQRKRERERCSDGEWSQSGFVALVAGTEPGNCGCASSASLHNIKSRRRVSQKHASRTDELPAADRSSDTWRHQSRGHLTSLKISTRWEQCGDRERASEWECNGNTFIPISV